MHVRPAVASITHESFFLMYTPTFLCLTLYREKLSPMYLENIAATGIKYRMLLKSYRPNVLPVNIYPTLLCHVLISVCTFAVVLVLISKCIMLRLCTA